MADVVEAWDSIHDELDVTDTIVLNGVQSSLFKDSATNGDFFVWESFCAI